MVFSKRIIEAKQNLGASHNIKAKARELRTNMTSAEKILWERLRKRQLNGMHFRRQHPYNIYILDFYCFEANLVIEVDGEIHLKRRIYDEERTKFLISSGVKVLRFSNQDIETKLDWVIERINNHLQYYPLPNLPPGGKETKTSLSPLGETGKGVKTKKGNNATLMCINQFKLPPSRPSPTAAGDENQPFPLGGNGKGGKNEKRK